MSMKDEVCRVSYEAALKMTEAIFRACSMTEQDAYMLADSLVRADMRGVKSHGLVRVPSYVKQLLSGVVSAKSDIEIVHETLFSTVINGHKGFGAVNSYHAIELTMKKAREHGVAFTAVRNSNHNGAEGLWTYLMSQEKDLIAFCATNSVPIVAPVNGVGRGVGSNPFSFSIPANRYANLCLDVSCGHMAQGKIWEYKRLNKKLPENAWMGPDGEITTDQNKWEVMDYIMLPFGGHKGFGISMIVEALTSALADADFQDSWNDVTTVKSTSHCFAAMRIDAFTDAETYRNRIDKYIDYIHALPVREGCPAPMFPGEIEASIEAQSWKDGVPVAKQILLDMLAAAEELHVDTSEYQKILAQ